MALCVAIAGTGSIGKVHARSARLAGAELAAVAASSPESAQAAAAELGADRACDSAEELLAGVRIVARGDALLDPSVTRSVIEEFSRKPRRDEDLGQKLEELTTRELEVLQLLARGLSNAEIAAELVVSDGTVKTHVARVLQKLGLRDRVQAVIFAYESGLVEAGAQPKT